MKSHYNRDKMFHFIDTMPSYNGYTLSMINNRISKSGNNIYETIKIKVK